MKKRNILVGVCGGIASYKTCELVRLFVRNGFSVKVIMTEAAAKFVTPLVFQNLSANPVYLDMFYLNNEENILHISLAGWADICVLAPLSANTLSKIAGGICDNLLTTVVCALGQETKVILAPAMNENMWKNSIIQENIGKLKKLKKYIILDSQKGELACGSYGEGRMPEPEEIYKKIKSVIGQQ
ncbi:MAG: flavoprotein [Candidatus Omnitrophota bacterium]|nr:flavoprotein [Candidatus Omnitrophota bacterium]